MTNRNLIEIYRKYFFCLLSAFSFIFISYGIGYCETDVSDKVKLNYSRAERISRTSVAYNASMTNISEEVLVSPVKVVIESISSPDVTVANADGTTEDGKPYFLYESELADGNLAPAEVSLQKKWIFDNPRLVRFGFTTKVLGTVAEAFATIGPEGGTVEVTDPESPIYGVKVEVPAGAISDDILLTMTENSTAPELPEEVIGSAPIVDFGPDGIEFESGVTITMPYYDVDNDGYLDGTDIKEENICALTYDDEFERWFYLKKISQDTDNNTATYISYHFSLGTQGGYNPNEYTRDDVVFFTIDGLGLVKTLLPGLISWSTRTAYLKPAIENMFDLDSSKKDVYSFGGGENESWDGDSNDTEYEVPKLVKVLNSEFNKHKSVGKKFIMITHSWGTVLGYLCLQYCPDVEPDLLITLSSPLGTDNVAPVLLDYWGLGLFVSDAQLIINGYTNLQKAETYARFLLKLKWPIKPVLLDNPDKAWINYWAMGDTLSGPLSPFLYNEIEDKKVDDLNSRTYQDMKVYHAITSLDEDGYWEEELDNPEDLNLARDFRDRVKADIEATIGEDPSTITLTFEEDPGVCCEGDTWTESGVAITVFNWMMWESGTSAGNVWGEGDIWIGGLLLDTRNIEVDSVEIDITCHCNGPGGLYAGSYTALFWNDINTFYPIDYAESTSGSWPAVSETIVLEGNPDFIFINGCEDEIHEIRIILSD